MPITSNRQGPGEKPDLSEALAVNEEMSRVLADKRKRRGARAHTPEARTLTSADELDVEGIYARFNAKNDAE